MGVFSDLLANSISIDNTLPTTSLDKAVRLEVDEWVNRGDAEYPTETVAANAVHTIAKDATDRTGGTFALTFALRNGETFTTAGIAFNANAGTIEAAIDAAADGVDEVQSIAQDDTDHTGGTFALTINLSNGESFTTAAIVFNAAAGVIETAIDVAATALPVTGWTNGDITVSGGILQAAGAAVVLTFDGASVDDLNHGLTVFDGALLTGGVEPATRVTVTTEGSAPVTGWTASDISVSGGILQAAGAAVVLTFDGTSVAGASHTLTVFDPALLTGGTEPATRMTQTTAGQTARPAWAALVLMGIATVSDIPVQGVAPAVFTSPTTPGGNASYPSQATIRAIAADAAINDDVVETNTRILAAARLPV